MKTSKRLAGVGEYFFSKKLREIEQLNQEGKNIINLGIGSPDLAPHPEVINVLQEESRKPNVHGYQSYKGSPVLRKAMAEWYKRWYNVNLEPEHEVLPLIGSKEGILHICMTYLNKGDKVLVPDPGYPTYQSAVKLAGGKCITYKLREKNNYFPDFKRIERKGLSNVKLMFLNYPQMPTGKYPETGLFEQFVEFGKKHQILLVHDNPYSFILNETPLSILSIEEAKETAVELNSLSKSHNMAGWRVGMLCGSKKNIDNVLRFKSNMDSGMFLPLQLAASKALSLEKEWYDEVNAVYRKRREKVFSMLDLMGCTFSEKQAGLFAWAKIPEIYKDGFELSDDILNQAAVFITPGGIFGEAGNDFIRISLCATGEKIDEATERIRQFVLRKVKA